MRLKWKFILFMVVVPSLALVIFLAVANSIFVSDKERFVVDTQISNLIQTARALNEDWLSTQVQNDLVFQQITAAGNKRRETPTELLIKAKLLQLWKTDGNDTKQFELGRGLLELRSSTFRPIAKAEDLFAKSNVQQFFFDHDGKLFHFNMGKHYASLNQVKPSIVEAVTDADLFTTYALDTSGNVLIGTSDDMIGKKLTEFDYLQVIDRVKDSRFLVETFKTSGNEGDQIFVAFSYLQALDLLLVSTIKQSVVQRSTLVFLYRSSFAFAVILSLAILLSLVFSAAITGNLEILQNAMAKVGNGDLSTRCQIRSNDEIGILSRQFNKLVHKLHHLVLEHEKKIEFERDLEVAQAVQETLLPVGNTQPLHGSLFSLYRPATYCGGDWWFFYEQNNKKVFMIGDATGHGVSAALTTAAARSAVAILEKMEELRPDLLMKMLNLSVYESTKGSMQMTFLIVVVDQSAGEVTYCNASHEVASLIRRSDGKIDKKSFRFLSDLHGPRIGERLDAEFSASKLSIGPGEYLIMHTDGIFELTGPRDGRPFSEIDFQKILIRSLNQFDKAEDVTKNISHELFLYHQDRVIPDDLAIVVYRHG